MENKNILDFFAEAGKLKYVKRSGWWMVGIPQEESVADHSFRCAVIGYILAKMEDAQPYKVLVMTLFNDLPEARINDMHKVASRYLNVKEAEKKAFTEQIEPLSKDISEEMGSLKEEYDKQETPESLIARDADILECLIQAKEYSDIGFRNAEKFFKKAPEHLATESARKLWEEVKSWDSNDWWERLGKFER
jgi:putative hydrolase of HD superfamily